MPLPEDKLTKSELETMLRYNNDIAGLQRMTQILQKAREDIVSLALRARDIDIEANECNVTADGSIQVKPLQPKPGEEKNAS